jgi:hypothetical protein
LIQAKACSFAAPQYNAQITRSKSLRMCQQGNSHAQTRIRQAGFPEFLVVLSATCGKGL